MKQRRFPADEIAPSRMASKPRPDVDTGIRPLSSDEPLAGSPLRPLGDYWQSVVELLGGKRVGFDWDPGKSDSNVEKHGIDFQDALRVFTDPRATTENVSKAEYGESRFKIVGMVDDELVAVIYPDRGAARRIISARRTRSNERRQYFDQGKTS